MNINRHKSLAGIFVTSLPLFVAVGCASNNDKLAQSDIAPVSRIDQAYSLQQSDEEHHDETQISVDESVSIAISNMEGYIEKSETPSAASPEPAVETKQHDLAILESVTDSIYQPPYEERLSSEVSNNNVVSDPTAQKTTAKLILPPPQKLVFHFASGEENLNITEHESINAHAEYLLQHPNYLLVVTGHSDSLGASDINQRLSELRAQNVADLIIAQGVSPEQLRVGGMGENVPMISPNNRDENRRVELTYQDSMVATKQ